VACLAAMRPDEVVLVLDGPLTGLIVRVCGRGAGTRWVNPLGTLDRLLLSAGTPVEEVCMLETDEGASFARSRDEVR
jgi:hypothetical protein